jgi:menaquinol-cytochrome c reductase iron-sulfur subunit
MSVEPQPSSERSAPGAAGPAPAPEVPTSRRGFYRLASGLLAGLIGLALAVPGLAYILTPLLRGRGRGERFTPVARFGDLVEGVPQPFPVIESRNDAWVRYPPEPVGAVWLIRQPAGAEAPVLALSAECPHLACAINLSPDGQTFFCPCHTSAFALDGARLNKVPPRGMDPLEVEPFDPSDPDAMVRVRFQRFRTMTEERIPLA